MKLPQRTIHRVLLGAVLMTVASGCSNSTSVQNDFNLARERWLQVAPSTYEITESQSCFCAPEVTRTVTLVVRNGVIESGRYTDTGEALSPSAAASHHTVNEMFDIIARASAQSGATVVAQYDADAGFPVSVSINSDLRALDGGVDYFMSNFRRL